jgi:FG-GAP repeat protein/VCBS repeat protein
MSRRSLALLLSAPLVLVSSPAGQGPIRPPADPRFPAAGSAPRAPVDGGEMGVVDEVEEPLGPGPVLAARKLVPGDPGLPNPLDIHEDFGGALAVMGDLDGDGNPELAVGTPNDDDNSPGLPYSQNGAVWILFLDAAGGVRSYQKISAAEGGFHGVLEFDRFGSAVTSPGDLDGDGTADLVVGTPFDDDVSALAAFDSGAAYVLFLNPDGTVRAEQKLARSAGGLVGLVSGYEFGSSLASPGDLDGDGLREIVVGVPFAPGQPAVNRSGEVWVLFLNPDGTVRAQQRIGNGLGGFNGTLDADDRFGSAVGSLGDLDGDGRPEIGVGAPLDSGPGTGVNFYGAVWILSLEADGTVASHRKLGQGEGGLSGIPRFTGFGSAILRLGDLDGDGIDDLVVGAAEDDGGATSGNLDYGALWMLYMAADGTVRSHTRIHQNQGGFPERLSVYSHLGSSLVTLGDLDGDGHPDLFAGEPGNDEGGSNHGALWLLHLEPDGTVGGSAKTGEGHGFPVSVDEDDRFGRSVAALGDLDGDGVGDLVVGAPRDAGHELSEGAVWVLFLEPDGAIKSHQRIAEGAGGFTGPIASNTFFGEAVASLGDLDGDGTTDVAVGAPNTMGSSFSGAGALWILFLNPDGTVKEERLIRSEEAGIQFGGFGSSVACAGDVDDDGIVDLAVGVPGDQRGGLVSLLFLQPDGSLRDHLTITEGEGGFTGDIDTPGDTEFGSALAGLGDLDGDGVPDLAVGAPEDDDGNPANVFDDRGAVWILFLERTGEVRAHQKISALQGGLAPLVPPASERFLGRALASLGDLDGDGRSELACGAFQSSGGAVRVLSLSADGTVAVERRIARNEGGLAGGVQNGDDFGVAAAFAGDYDGDGVRDLAVGAIGDDGRVDDLGAVWMLALDGLARVDFETHGDLVTPLENGRQIVNARHFGRAFDLLSSGANRGAAIFDSTPGGPNDPSQDPDLLVGQGKVLIFQDSNVSTQSVPGIFDRPNDDADGGSHRLDFHGPVRFLALDLIDVDGRVAEMSSVRLIDGAGRVRTYLVPPGFTGDRVQDGTSGVRTLDLTRLDPQPGFASTATAAEDPGFQPDAVLVLEVDLGGSGAVDSLRFDPQR